MTLEDLLTRFGNWVIMVLGGIVAYVAWRERTVSRVATLARDLERTDRELAKLQEELRKRAATDASIAGSLATIIAQISSLTQAVAELKADVRRKADKE